MPIRVVFDTNVYSQDKFRLGQDFKTVGSLCKSGDVELLVPYIVRREFETKLHANASEVVANFMKAAKRLASGPIPTDLRSELDSFIEKLSTQKEEVIASHDACFAAWLSDHGASILELDPAHAVGAMRAYFDATPPFRSAKRREDIPDAMIYRAVLTLATNSPLAFVCADQKLARALKNEPNVVVYNTLGQFIASSAVQALIAQPGGARQPAEILMALKALSTGESNLLRGYVSDHGSEDLAGTMFSSPSIPGDDREAYIAMFGSLEDIEFDWDNAVHHGGYVFVVPFCGQGPFEISYYVPMSDIHEIKERGGTYSPHNDYVVEANEETELSVRGTLRIQINSDTISSGDLVDAIDALSIDSLEDPVLLEDWS